MTPPNQKYAYICIDCPVDNNKRTMHGKSSAEQHHGDSGHRIAYLSLAFGVIGDGE